MKKYILVILILIVLVSGCGIRRNRYNRPIDNTNIQEPTDGFIETSSLESVYITTELGFVFDSIINGDYIYVVGHEGLNVLDISNLNNIQKIESIESDEKFNDIVISGKYAYITAGQRRMPNGKIKIFDISDPDNLIEIKNDLILPEAPIGIIVEDNIAYIGDYASGLFIVDVSDPSNLNILSNFRLENPEDYVSRSVVEHVWWPEIKYPYAYITYDAAGFHILDISNPKNPVLIDSFDKNNKGADYFFNEVEIIGDYAYIALDYGGILILDISDKENIREVKHVDVWSGCLWQECDGHMVHLEIKDDIAYLTAGRDGLYIYDLSNPKNPILIDKITESKHKGCAWGMDLDKDLISVSYTACEVDYKIVGALEIFKINN